MDNFPQSIQTIVRDWGFFMRKVMIILFMSVLVFFYFQPRVSANQSADIKSIDLNLEDGEVAITFLNLSNGEATLIQNEQENLLVNTGGIESQQELKHLLSVYKVHSINTVLLTHFDKTYTGNLTYVINHYHVKRIITSDTIKQHFCHSESSVSAYCFLFHQLSQKRDEILPRFKVKLLSEAVDGRQNLLMNYGDHHIIYLTYDDEQFEEALAEKNIPQATILKVSNYGEEPSINSKFLTKIDPQMAVIFHRLNHKPSDQVLAKLQIEWMDLYQTFQMGCVTVKMSPTSYEVFTFSPMEKKTKRFGHLLQFFHKMITMELTNHTQKRI